MKRAGITLMVLLLFGITIVKGQTGADCTTAIPLTMDGVCRTYATSSSTGASINCVDNTGNAPITYFSFTTNAVPEKVMINITGPSGQPVEVVMQANSCSFSYSSNSMCFYDGEGIWAPSHVFSPSASTTYKLRVRTNVAGNIIICAQYYTPSNDDCNGAMQITSNGKNDNNATQTAGPTVLPSQLCASTLENTAFYMFTVESAGTSIINLNNIQCDNNYGANSNGFQIGFFTGSCSSLTPISCYSGSGSFVSATTPSLDAGTNVYVAVDGTAGSNCRYEISAINSMILAATLKDFAGWKKENSNLLKWNMLDEKESLQYEIQRSYNKKDFIAIGQVRSASSSAYKKEYQFEDNAPAPLAYYRIKILEAGNKHSYSKTILVKRNTSPLNRVEITNPVTGGILSMRVFSETKADYNLSIINSFGQVVLTDKLKCNAEVVTYTKSVNSLPKGIYHLMINDPDFQVVKSFVKN